VTVVNRPLATSCEILTSAKFLVALATRKAQFWTLNRFNEYTIAIHGNRNVEKINTGCECDLEM